MATFHTLQWTDLCCLCDSEAQCRACQGRAHKQPPGFEPNPNRHDPNYVGRHRVWEVCN